MEDEFRFVVLANQIKALEVDSSKSIDFNDYYLSREKRIREIVRSNDVRLGKFFMIEAKPGSIIKKKIEISQQEAKSLTREFILIIEKKGIGRISVDDAQGYAERVIIIKKGSKNPIIDEIHIEFEEDFSKIDVLVKKLKPLKVIRVGLFDYAASLKT